MGKSISPKWEKGRTLTNRADPAIFVSADVGLQGLEGVATRETRRRRKSSHVSCSGQRKCARTFLDLVQSFSLVPTSKTLSRVSLSLLISWRVRMSRGIVAAAYGRRPTVDVHLLSPLFLSYYHLPPPSSRLSSLSIIANSFAHPLHWLLASSIHSPLHLLIVNPIALLSIRTSVRSATRASLGTS